MKKLNCLALGLCLMSGAAVAADNTSPNTPATQPGASQSGPVDRGAVGNGSMGTGGGILDHERREEQRSPGVGSGAGTDGTDSRTSGSGTDSDSVPNNIPPARAN